MKMTVLKSSNLFSEFLSTFKILVVSHSCLAAVGEKHRRIKHTMTPHGSIYGEIQMLLLVHVSGYKSPKPGGEHIKQAIF